MLAASTRNNQQTQHAKLKVTVVCDVLSDVFVASCVPSQLARLRPGGAAPVLQRLRRPPLSSRRLRECRHRRSVSRANRRTPGVLDARHTHMLFLVARGECCGAAAVRRRCGCLWSAVVRLEHAGERRQVSAAHRESERRTHTRTSLTHSLSSVQHLRKLRFG
jgi:hypothetical protein